MNKEQMMKDFSELYIGKNPRQLVKEYEKKKKKEMFLLLSVAIIIVALCYWNDQKYSEIEENYKLFRGDAEKGKQEIALQIKTSEEEWKDITIELYPKEYSKDELEKLYIEVSEKIPEIILNKNLDLDNVNSDLNLIKEIKGYPFLLTWQSSNPDILDYEGKVKLSRENLDCEVELTAVLEYGEWKKEVKLFVHIIKNVNEEFVSVLQENLNAQEKMTREEKEFLLPDKFQDKVLQWRYPPGNSAIVLTLLFIVILPLISGQKDKEIHNEVKRRKDQMLADFPEFISKLILLMEAGMNIRGAVFQIVEDRKKLENKKKNYLQEELMYICRQMQNGLSEKEAYELLGKRCNLPCYKKLSGLLIQHLQKGGSRILDTLRIEAQKANEEQKRKIQKRGEEMGTKLLFPMIIMLGIVMIFIMVPALFSFQM